MRHGVALLAGVALSLSLAAAAVCRQSRDVGRVTANLQRAHAARLPKLMPTS